ncbi:CopG family transcriptional regulator [Microvirga sp. KLBC 81]|uniref:CopG family transcriptional regulator n=1 Tax=Microvirga sp. KLBC 81 TaxID=1862707 RepID=UPI001FDFEB6D|nr:CopG family transcriptional regulator [Microvirga sp. KLBC 81]
MAGRKKKTQISVYLDPDVMAMLADYAARREQSLSLIAEAAIASFLSPDDAERREAVIAKRLDQLDRRMTRLERDVGISVETLAVFIRFWLATTPALPEPAAQAARAKARERYEAFVTALGRRLAKGPKLRQEVSEDIASEHGAGSMETSSGRSRPGDAVRDNCDERLD